VRPEALEHFTFPTSRLPDSHFRTFPVLNMTKIVLKSEAAPLFEVFKTPLSILLYPAVVAYHESQSAIYVADPYADLAVGRLTEGGLSIDVVKL
jgi:hypothetical protein